MANPSARSAQNPARCRLLALLALCTTAVLLLVTYDPPHTGRLLFGGYRLKSVLLALVGGWATVLACLHSRSQLAVMRWLLLSGAFVLAWGCAEVAALVLTPATAEEPTLGAQPLPNADLRGTTPPDIAASWGLPHDEFDFHFQTNGWGFRNPPDLENADVFCIGDSLLVAIQIPREQTIPGVLAHELQLPVGNVSLIAKSVQEMQKIFDALGADLTGRVVLQFVCEDNDLLDSLALADAPAAGSAPNTTLWQRTLLQRAVVALQRYTQPQVAEARRRCGTFDNDRVLFAWHHQSSPQLDGQVPVVLEALRSFAASVTARGGKFGIVLIPAKLRVLAPHCQLPPDFDFEPLMQYCSPLAAALAEFTAQEGLPYLSAEPALRMLAEAGELPWLRDDTHLTAAGHRAVVTALLQWPWLRTALAR